MLRSLVATLLLCSAALSLETQQAPQGEATSTCHPCGVGRGGPACLPLSAPLVAQLLGQGSLLAADGTVAQLSATACYLDRCVPQAALDREAFCQSVATEGSQRLSSSRRLLTYNNKEHQYPAFAPAQGPASSTAAVATGQPAASAPSLPSVSSGSSSSSNGWGGRGAGWWGVGQGQQPAAQPCPPPAVQFAAADGQLTCCSHPNVVSVNAQGVASCGPSAVATPATTAASQVVSPAATAASQAATPVTTAASQVATPATIAASQAATPAATAGVIRRVVDTDVASTPQAAPAQGPAASAACAAPAVAFTKADGSTGCCAPPATLTRDANGAATCVQAANGQPLVGGSGGGVNGIITGSYGSGGGSGGYVNTPENVVVSSTDVAPFPGGTTAPQDQYVAEQAAEMSNQLRTRWEQSMGSMAATTSASATAGAPTGSPPVNTNTNGVFKPSLLQEDAGFQGQSSQPNTLQYSGGYVDLAGTVGRVIPHTATAAICSDLCKEDPTCVAWKRKAGGAEDTMSCMLLTSLKADPAASLQLPSTTLSKYTAPAKLQQKLPVVRYVNALASPEMVESGTKTPDALPSALYGCPYPPVKGAEGDCTPPPNCNCFGGVCYNSC